MMKGVAKGKGLDKKDIFDKSYDYVYCVDTRTSYLTNKGIKFIEDFMKTKNLVSSIPILYGAILNTIEADKFCIKGKDYLLSGNAIKWINRESGRVLETVKRDRGIQRALEIKENVEITSFTSSNINSMSYQVFFNKFNFIAGTSGTVKGAEMELDDIFGLGVLLIPEHNKSIRVDYEDIIVKTLDEGYDVLINLVEKIHSKGRPILILSNYDYGVYPIEERLQSKGLSYNILNNTNSNIEEQVIAKAGEVGSITVSTNMLGRGTNIILTEEAKEKGGLFIICLGHYESIRVDNQVRGRAGRQGEPGSSLFIVTLDDDIFDHVLERKVKKYKNVDINNESMQYKIRRDIKNVQINKDRSMAKSRIRMYKMDSIIEDYRNYVRLHKFVQGKYTDYIRKYTLNKYFHVYDNKVSEFGKDLSDNIIKSLIDYEIKSTWGYCKEDLIILREHIGLKRVGEDKLIQTFIEDSSLILEEYINNLCKNVSNYFLDVRREDNEKIS